MNRNSTNPNGKFLVILCCIIGFLFNCGGSKKSSTNIVNTEPLDISNYIVSPNGSQVVYRAKYDTDEVYELYSVPITGGTPVKLNKTFVASYDVSDSSIKISSDGSQVVYRAKYDTDEVYELYSVPITGGTPVKLNGSLASGGHIFNYEISPDGSRVVYRAEQDTDNVPELYSVLITGGTPVKLNGSLVSGGYVSGYAIRISPDGSRVIYIADQDTDGVNELYSVPMTGGTPVKLNGSFVSGGAILGLRMSPDGSQIVYLADQDTDGIYEIYLVPITGGTPVKLNSPLVSGGGITTYYGISPDGSRAVYMADQDTDEVYELYSVPTSGGGTSIKLNSPLVSGGDVTNYSPEISPDGSRVIYMANQDTNNVLELYSVPIMGGTPVKLNSSLISSGDVKKYSISSDGSRVVYMADQDTDEVLELYSVPIAGGTAVKLNGSLVAGGNVSIYHVKICPDGSQVTYMADQDTDGVNELYSVPMTGGTAVKLNGSLVAGRYVRSSLISASGSRVVFKTSQEDSEVKGELYSVEITGGTPVKLGSIKN